MKSTIEYVSPELEVTLVEDDILTLSLENETHYMPGVNGEDDND